MPNARIWTDKLTIPGWRLSTLTNEEFPMKQTLLWCLAVLNVLLLAMFVARMTKENVASAQVRPRPGDYLLISGEAQGVTSDVVYVVDQANGQLGAVSYELGRTQLDVMAPIALARFTEAPPGAVTPGAPMRG